ncbi:hypothetical protein [Nostoc sp. CCY 9925]|uniref:hypothetical protein n=1 Tax=Nostoc sp. CCY 9925 TaxID=3103865 RepID=UPI0039C6CD07
MGGFPDLSKVAFECDETQQRRECWVTLREAAFGVYVLQPNLLQQIKLQLLVPIY